MKTFTLLVALIASILTYPAAACGVARTDESIPITQFLPYAELSTRHWPDEYDIRFGGLVSFLVPKGTSVSLTALAKGMSEPLVTVKEEVVSRVRPRLKFATAEQIVAFDARKYEWVYVHAASYGKSEVILKGPNGWTHSMKVGVVYPPRDEAVGRTPVFMTLAADSEATITVDGYDNILLSVPGEVADHWRLAGEKETGFKLTRIEMQELPYGDTPRVRLFLSGTSSPRSGPALIRREGSSGNHINYRFKLEARPTPSC